MSRWGRRRTRFRGFPYPFLNRHCVTPKAFQPRQRPMAPVYSLVLPLFNEEAVVPLLFRRLDALLDALDGPAEVILVDDGSKDSSPRVLEAKAKADPRYRYLRLARNFGHQIAIT